MPNRQNRRYKTQCKINKRAKMAKIHGLREGTMYEKHISKLDRSFGYMRDGNVTHYVRVGYGRKTNNRGNYGKHYNPSIRDRRNNALMDQWE